MFARICCLGAMLSRSWQYQSIGSLVPWLYNALVEIPKDGNQATFEKYREGSQVACINAKRSPPVQCVHQRRLLHISKHKIQIRQVIMGGIPHKSPEVVLVVGVILDTILTSVTVALVIYVRVCKAMGRAKRQRSKLQAKIDKLRNRSPGLSRWRVYTSYTGTDRSFTAVKPMTDTPAKMKVPTIPGKFDSASNGTTYFWHKDEHDSRCYICSQDWQVDDVVSIDLDCGDVFHHECLTAWFKKATTPTCVRCQTKFEWQHSLVAKK